MNKEKHHEHIDIIHCSCKPLDTMYLCWCQSCEKPVEVKPDAVAGDTIECYSCGWVCEVKEVTTQ